MTKQEYVDYVKVLFISAAQNWFKTWIVTQLPFLAKSTFNPIYFLILKLSEKVITAMANAAEMKAFFWFIDMRVKGQEKSFNEAADEFYQAKLSGDKERIANAEKKFIDAFNKFADFKS